MVKVTVVGIGNMGENHARIYSGIHDVDLFAGVDKNEIIGKEIAKRFNTNFFVDYKCMGVLHNSA